MTFAEFEGMPRDQGTSIDVAHLLGSSTAGEVLVYDPLIESLPIEKLGWEKFEMMCAHLIAKLDSDILEARRYGASGQAQFGIDIVALRRSSNSRLFAQCKHVKALKRGQIATITRKFLSEGSAHRGAEFILCVSTAIETDRQLADEWFEAHKLLQESGVHGTLWDLGTLNKLLRSHPEIVETFFGKQFVPRFCSYPIPPERYPSKYRTQYSSASEPATHDGFYYFEDTTVRLDMFVPSDRSPKVSCMLLFARSDLHGMAVSIPGETIVSWMRWLAHSGDSESRPYAVPVPRENRYVLQAPHVRLVLEADELQNLEWILRAAWPVYLAAARKIEQQWRCLRFRQVEGAQKNVFGIVRVTNWLWRAIIKFANSHDCDAGAGPMYVFDRAPGVLKVYVDRDTSELDRGYHLIMYAYKEAGVASLWGNDDVVLGWEPLEVMEGGPAQIGPRNAWDAEFAHQWILETLLPNVEHWINASEPMREPGLRGVLETIMRRPNPHVSVKDDVRSLANLSQRELTNESSDCSVVFQQVAELQLHFHSYASHVAVETSLISSIIAATSRIVDCCNDPDDRYIRNTLQLSDGLLSDELSKLATSGEIKPTKMWMDLSLRCLLSALESSPKLSTSEFGRLLDNLRPAWERMREDMICDSLA
jgi:hypothetical protein